MAARWSWPITDGQRYEIGEEFVACRHNQMLVKNRGGRSGLLFMIGGIVNREAIGEMSFKAKKHRNRRPLFICSWQPAAAAGEEVEPSTLLITQASRHIGRVKRFICRRKSASCGRSND